MVVAFLLPVAFSPEAFHPYWAPKAAVCLLAAGPGLVALTHLVRARDRAARLAAAFLAAAALSTVVSDRPVASLTGAANWGTGLLFVAAVVGCWALGVVASPVRRRQLVTAVVAGAALNAAMAWFQAAGLAPDLLQSADRAHGFTGNPIHLGALSAAALWLVAVRVGRERGSLRGLAVVALLAGAVQVSGGRSALALGLVALVGALRRAGRERAVAIAAAAILGVVGASAVAGDQAATGSARATGATTAQADVRIEFWKIGAAAAADRPLLGWGPGRFEAATSPRYTPTAIETGSNVYRDAHNWVVEYAVTTGLVGLALLLGWLLLAGRGAGGPLAGVAVVIGLASLLEPQSVVVTPLALLALGAARREPGTAVPTRAPWRAATALSLAAGLAAGGVLLAGEVGLRDAKLDTSVTAYQSAAALLPPWPEVSVEGSRISAFHGIHDDDERARSLALARQATRRDPADARAWGFLAQLELTWGTDEGAAHAVEQGLDRNPWMSLGLVAAAGLGERTGDEGLRDLACGRLETLGRTLPEVCP